MIVNRAAAQSARVIVMGTHGRTGFKRILCAMDFSPSSPRAREYALDLGRPANGRVTVVFVFAGALLAWALAETISRLVWRREGNSETNR
jgi:nucleotide-binding universal stress UspA family protein